MGLPERLRRTDRAAPMSRPPPKRYAEGEGALSPSGGDHFTANLHGPVPVHPEGMK